MAIPKRFGRKWGGGKGATSGSSSKSSAGVKKKPKYRSGLEHFVAVFLDGAHIPANHEKETLKYLVPAVTKRYLVDFSLPTHPALVVEVKGRFTSVDRKKMLYIHTQYPDRHVIMLFGKAQNKLSKKSNTTYADWCDKN